ncbi:MAG: hypothetical protein ACYC1D_02440 [Acidimicrobiales bacterium]
MSRKLPVEAVPLDSIGEIDTPYWFGGSAETPTVRKVVEHTGVDPRGRPGLPDHLGTRGPGHGRMHRVARALMAGRTHIDAVRFPAPLAADYRNCQPRDLPY